VFAQLPFQVYCNANDRHYQGSKNDMISFSALFGYNPVGWLCLFILIAGILGSARIVLGHHTLGEVLSGFAVGLICALLVLHPVSNILFRVFLF